MPLVEEGVKYPREVPGPFGLPAGWKAIERKFGDTSKCAGQTYIRYAKPDGKGTFGSVKAAIKEDALDRGADPDQAVQDWEVAVQQEKDEKQREREENGFAEGKKLEDAIECFRAKYGQLNGATVNEIPGWRGESKIQESGQIGAMYYGPHGWRYPLLKNIEAYFGMRMLAGLEVPDIEAARNAVQLDENGKPINKARRDNIVETLSHVEHRNKKSRRNRFLEEDEVTNDDFQPSEVLFVVKLLSSKSSKELEKIGVGALGELDREVSEIKKILEKRGFGEDVKMLYVTGSHKHMQGSTNVLDCLSGVYYKRPGEINGKSVYQKIVLSESSPIGVECNFLHLFWSSTRSCWKLGKADDTLAGFARCFDSDFTGTTTKWRVLARQSHQ